MTPLVLHSSPVRLTLQLVTPALVVVFAVANLGRGGVAPVVVLAIGMVFALVALLDLPLRSEFDEDGVTRVCPLRRHRLPWGRVVAVERFGREPRRRDGETSSAGGRLRGLVARTGPRRVHLLVDRRESQAEWEALRRLLGERATQLRAAQPPLDALPAGRGERALHRRSRD